jgi:hypothetical protein
MNKIIILILLLFTAYSINNLDNIENNIKTTGISIDDSEYKIHIDIENTTKGEQNLVVKIKLKNNSHFISPNDPGTFKGKFYMDLGSYNHIDFDGKLIENPMTIEKFEPNTFEKYKAFWVTADTTYRQPLNVISDGDFEVFGRVNFVIEPKCTLEQLTFGINYKNGVLKVTQAKC